MKEMYAPQIFTVPTLSKTSMSLSTLESELDQFFSAVKLPSDSLYLSRWYCLMVTEDCIRNLFDQEDLSPQLLGPLVDQTKYSLKHIFLRLNHECKELGEIRLPREVVPKFYKTTSRLYFAGLDFSRAYRLVASLHSGSASIEHMGDSEYKISIMERNSAPSYAALELLAVQRQEVPGFITIMLSWLRGIDVVPLVVDAIAASVIKSKRLLHYTYDGDFAFELAQSLPQQPNIIPESWEFEWGDRHNTNLLLNSMTVRLLYHFVAIHFGARRLSHRGGGHENLVLVIDRSALIKDIKVLSSLQDETVGTFVDALTYGSGTNSPDPALQPFISAGGSRLLIAPSFWLSGNIERNLLSLQARRHSRSFDRQSGAFEKEMLRELGKSKGLILNSSRKGITLRSGREREEIDLLVWDEQAHILLVCEMRAMLQPGDPREVLNRKKEIQRKVVQAQRKVQWIKDNPKSIINSLGIEVGLDWSIRGLVTVAGYGGAASEISDISVIPFELFLVALREAAALSDLVAWIDKLDWQPKENEDYHLIENEQMLPDGPKITSEGIELMIFQNEFFLKALKSLQRK